MKKRVLSIAILSALILSQISCGTENEQNNDSADSNSSDTTAVESADEGILSKLNPELKTELGLDGYEFNVLLREPSSSWTIHDLIAEEQNGEVLNDAVYRRNIWLEDNYGFTINAGYSADASCSELSTFILAGDDTYDAFFPMGRTAGSAATQGLLYDLKELEYLDLDNACWNKMFSDSLEIDGKLFYAAGAVSTNSYDAVRHFMFNKTLLSKYNLENPYELVKNGAWTFDKLNEMASAASDDINGDTKMTVDDQYGLGWQKSIGGTVFMYAFGEISSKNNKDGIPEFSLDTERFTNIYTKIRDTISDSNVYYYGADDDVLKMFYDERSLFYTEVINTAKKLRNYDVDFGLLPLPKYNEEQEEYIQFVDGWCLSPIVVAKNNSNPDRTGFIIEALAEASHDFIVTPYYETVLNGKVLRDAESSEMLDIIVNNFVLDNCDLYQWGGIVSAIRDGMEKGNDVSSIIASNKSAIEAAIEKTVTNIQDK